MDGFEAFYDTRELHPCDLLGVLMRETVLTGIVNNFPIRRRAVPYDSIELYAGNKRRLRVYIKDANLDIINLTGALCVFSFRKQKGGPIIFQKKTSNSSEGMIGSADQGECFFYLESADTTNLDIAQYVFDVTVVLTGNDGPYTTVEGVVNLQQSVY
jgi:hypothetical protein